MIKMIDYKQIDSFIYFCSLIICILNLVIFLILRKHEEYPVRAIEYIIYKKLYF
jgi:hypothetical protein